MPLGLFVEGGAWRISPLRLVSNGWVRAVLLGEEDVWGNIRHAHFVLQASRKVSARQTVKSLVLMRRGHHTTDKTLR
jgi:hypothetical protein